MTPRVANVKGSALASRVLWVRLHHGEEGERALRQAATPALRAALDAGVVKARWYPFEEFVELTVLIDRLFGAGDLELARALGRHGADANLTTIYRLFYRLGTVRWVMSRAAGLWGLHYDAGRLTVDSFPDKEVLLRIHDFPTPHRAHCLSVWGWAERAMELSGGRVVEAVEIGCRTEGAAVCALRATWQ